METHTPNRHARRALAARANQAPKKGKNMKEVEFKTPRTLPEIQQEFNQLAGAAGDTSYRIAQGEENLQQLHAGMKILEKEAFMAQRKLDAETKAKKLAEEKTEGQSTTQTETPAEAVPELIKELLQEAQAETAK